MLPQYCAETKLIKMEDIHGDAIGVEKPRQNRPASLAPNAPRWRIKEQRELREHGQALRVCGGLLTARGNPRSLWAAGASPTGI